MVNAYPIYNSTSVAVFKYYHIMLY